MNKDIFTGGLSLISFNIFANQFKDYLHFSNSLLGIILISGIAVTGISFLKFENKLDEIFNGIGFKNKEDISPAVVNQEKTDYGINYTLTLPAGLNIDCFKKYKLAFEQNLNAKVEFEYQDKHVIAKVIDKKLGDFYPFTLLKSDHPMDLLIGNTIQGFKWIRLDRHMLIAGTSGFGKSTLERAILTTLICNNTKENLCINLYDAKRCELSIFKKSELVNTFCYDVEGLTNLLVKIEKEVEGRYKIFEKLGYKDIESYNANESKKLKHIVNFYDEIAQLEGNKKIYAMWQRRLSYDRGAGVFHVMCTQRPSADLLPGKIKANIDIRVCFRTVDSTNSWIVLDQEKTAEYLKEKGRGLLKIGADLEEFQAMYITEKEAVEKIKHTFKEDL